MVVANQTLGIYHFGIHLLNANWHFGWSLEIEKLVLAAGVAIAAVREERDREKADGRSVVQKDAHDLDLL